MTELERQKKQNKTAQHNHSSIWAPTLGFSIFHVLFAPAVFRASATASALSLDAQATAHPPPPEPTNYIVTKETINEHQQVTRQQIPWTLLTLYPQAPA